MQLTEQVLISCPTSIVIDLLSQEAGSWLVPFVRIAGHVGEETGLAVWEDADVDPPPLPDPQDRRVSVTVGRPILAGRSTVMRLICRASGYVTLFKELSGSIEVAAASEDESTITIAARCRASGKLPPGAVGRRVSERAARSAVACLLGNLRSALEELSRRDYGDDGEVDAGHLSRL
jgi:hypothetical protein